MVTPDESILVAYRIRSLQPQKVMSFAAHMAPPNEPRAKIGQIKGITFSLTKHDWGSLKTSSQLGQIANFINRNGGDGDYDWVYHIKHE